MSQEVIWTDVTSYSRGDKERTPRSWQTLLGDIRLVVTRYSCGDKDTWYCTCQPWFEYRPLCNSVIDDAKAEALRVIRGKVEEVADALNIPLRTP